MEKGIQEKRSSFQQTSNSSLHVPELCASPVTKEEWFSFFFIVLCTMMMQAVGIS